MTNHWMIFKNESQKNYSPNLGCENYLAKRIKIFLNLQGGLSNK